MGSRARLRIIAWNRAPHGASHLPWCAGALPSGPVHVRWKKDVRFWPEADTRQGGAFCDLGNFQF